MLARGLFLSVNSGLGRSLRATLAEFELGIQPSEPVGEPQGMDPMDMFYTWKTLGTDWGVIFGSKNLLRDSMSYEQWSK